MRHWNLQSWAVSFCLCVGVASAMSQPADAPLPPRFIARDGIGNVLQKLKQGDTVRVAYFGGSITASEGWRVMTTQWLQSHYPKAKIVEVMASIGGDGQRPGRVPVGPRRAAVQARPGVRRICGQRQFCRASRD